MMTEGSKRWLPHLIASEHHQVNAWTVGYYDGNCFLNDGRAYTYSKAEKRASELNQQRGQGIEQYRATLVARQALLRAALHGDAPHTAFRGFSSVELEGRLCEVSNALDMLDQLE